MELSPNFYISLGALCSLVSDLSRREKITWDNPEQHALLGRAISDITDEIHYRSKPNGEPEAEVSSLGEVEPRTFGGQGEVSSCPIEDYNNDLSES